MISVLKEISQIRSSKRDLRDFGVIIGMALLAFAALVLWRSGTCCIYLFLPGILFASLGLIAPILLLPLQKAWMTFSILIGFIMSHMILTLLFYVVIAPMGLLIRLCGKDILDQNISKTRPSYWHMLDAAAKTKESYENQY